MELTIKTDIFATELGIVALAAERRGSMPILGCVLIEAKKATLPGDDDEVKITATDLDIALWAVIKADVKTAGAAAVPLKKLMDYVRLVDGDEITIKDTAKLWVQVTSGNSKNKMAGMNPENFPTIDQASASSATIPAKPLASAIRRVALAVTRQQSRFTVNGALLEFINENTARLVTTDGHRLCLAEVEYAGTRPTGKTIIPLPALSALEKLAEFSQLAESFRYGIAGGTNYTGMVFSLGRRELFVRGLAGSFPDYERALPPHRNDSLTVDRNVLLRAIGRSVLFSDDRSHAVKLTIDAASEIRISSAVADAGESEEVVPAEVDGGHLEAGYSGKYIAEFLSVAGTDRVLFTYKDVNSPLVCRPVVEGAEAETAKRYDCLIMPMRI